MGMRGRACKGVAVKVRTKRKERKCEYEGDMVTRVRERTSRERKMNVRGQKGGNERKDTNNWESEEEEAARERIKLKAAEEMIRGRK